MSHVGWQYPKYPRAAGQYLFAGNSLTLGFGTSSTTTMSYPAQVMQILESSDVYYNLGVNSQTTPQMAAQAAAVVDPKYNSSIVNRLIVWEGTNDLFTGASAATAAQNLNDYCTARRAVGFKVVIVTILPLINGADPTFDTDRKAANAIIRSTWTTYADGIADVALTSGDVLENPNNAAYFYTDKTHLIDAGAEVVARIVVDALRGLP